MARRYSSVFGVSSARLRAEGAFDGFVGIDSPFHIDPFLLRAPKAKELRGSYRRFRTHFRNVLTLLAASKRPGDRFFRQAEKSLTFPELKSVSLGYSKGSSSGSGIGPGLAAALATTASDILDAGIKDPVVFELVGLIEDGVGADRISDMTVQVILPDLLRFTERVATRLHLPSSPVKHETKEYNIPTDPRTGTSVVLIPEELLRDLPVAYDWDDIDRVCRYNQALRLTVNKLIGRTWKHATRKVTKRELKDALLRYPGLLKDLISQYNAKSPVPYDFGLDPGGHLSWDDTAKDFASRFPIKLALAPRGSARAHDVVSAVCAHFKRLVEENGLSRLMYDRAGRLRHESYAQLLFFGIADAYCDANNLDLSREPNAGRGPVDFKVSKGYTSRVLVEVKYSSNSKLKAGFKAQLPAYAKAERATTAIYLIVRTTPTTKTIDAIRRMRSQAIRNGLRVPELLVVDARQKRSASRL